MHDGGVCSVFFFGGDLGCVFIPKKGRPESGGIGFRCQGISQEVHGMYLMFLILDVSGEFKGSGSSCFFYCAKVDGYRHTALASVSDTKTVGCLSFRAV